MKSEAVTDQVPNFFESLTTLASVAGRVSRIGVAVHGLILPIRDPRLFAKQIATIAEMSDHRLTVAPAIGGSHDDFDAAGVKVLDGEIIKKMDELLAAAVKEITKGKI